MAGLAFQRYFVSTQHLATKAPRDQDLRIILYYRLFNPDKSGLKLMKKLRYSIYIHFLFGSLCLGGWIVTIFIYFSKRSSLF